MNRIAAMLFLLAFYSFYIARLLIQKRQGIRTNQMGIGKKPAKVLWVERITMCATVLQCIVSIISLLAAAPPTARVLPGILTGLSAVIFFAAATITMKTSWRVGIPQEKTVLITNGIYRISRNPAFMGFDLLYLSSCLLLPNVPLLLASLLAAVMLHLQILKEEEHLLRVFGQEYAVYMQRVRRYIGRR